MRGCMSLKMVWSGEPAVVQFSVVRIAATDEHSVLPVAPPIRERHRLVVQQEVRDRPGHSALKRGLCGCALISAVALRKWGSSVT
jgi:hypothetical protein